MRDRMERLILLPFTAGCVSESSIPVVAQHTRRSKLDTTTPTRTREEERKDDDDEEVSLDDEESFSRTLQRFQKVFKNIKNLSQLFVYKDELEPEMRMEIGLPTDVKHVTHIGMDGCASSIFSKGSWNNLAEPELINLHSFPLTQLQLAINTQVKTTSNSNDNAIAQT